MGKGRQLPVGAGRAQDIEHFIDRDGQVQNPLHQSAAKLHSCVLHLHERRSRIARWHRRIHRAGLRDHIAVTVDDLSSPSPCCTADNNPPTPWAIPTIGCAINTRASTTKRAEKKARIGPHFGARTACLDAMSCLRSLQFTAAMATSRAPGQKHLQLCTGVLHPATICAISAGTPEGPRDP